MLTSQPIQFSLLGLTAILFALAFGLGLGHLRRVSRMLAGSGARPPALPHEASMGPAARAAVLLGTVLGIGLLAWRAFSEHAPALPFCNPFDAFLILALVLAFILVYFRWTRNLRSFSFFLLPMIVILLAIGLILAAFHPQSERQNYLQAWLLLHLIGIVAGTVCFALSCVGGIVYLLADRQLRVRSAGSAGTVAAGGGSAGGTVGIATGHGPHRWFGYPPLGAIEKFNQAMVYIGFPLLTLATLAGILWLAQTQAGGAGGGGGAAVEGGVTATGFAQWFKLGCAVLAWAVYAVLLQVPLNPRLRGRTAAWLALAGFSLFIGAFVAARWS